MCVIDRRTSDEQELYIRVQTLSSRCISRRVCRPMGTLLDIGSSRIPLSVSTFSTAILLETHQDRHMTNLFLFSCCEPTISTA